MHTEGALPLVTVTGVGERIMSWAIGARLGMRTEGEPDPRTLHRDPGAGVVVIANNKCSTRTSLSYVHTVNPNLGPVTEALG